jgi:dihydroxy-acid dehydratase
VGGPLALLRDGDLVSLDVSNRTLNVLITDAEIAARRAEWIQPPMHYSRGYGALYSERVSQAHEGCDFDFLERAGETPEPEIH